MVDYQIQQYQSQFIQQIVPVVVAMAFITLLILEVIKKFKEVL